jgi:hypothetical protein
LALGYDMVISSCMCRAVTCRKTEGHGPGEGLAFFSSAAFELLEREGIEELTKVHICGNRFQNSQDLHEPEPDLTKMRLIPVG